MKKLGQKWKCHKKQFKAYILSFDGEECTKAEMLFSNVLGLGIRVIRISELHRFWYDSYTKLKYTMSSDLVI